MIQRHKVDELRGIFCISRADIFQNHICDILHFVPVVPKRIEQLHVLLCERSLYTVDHVVAVISAFTTNIDRCKAANRHISGLCCAGIHSHKASHIFSPVVFDLNVAFLLIQSAHSFAMALWVISLRSLISNSVP